MTIHFLSQLKPIQTLRINLQTPLLHLFPSKSSRKRYGFLFSHLVSRVLGFIFVSIYVSDLFFFFNGFVLMFLGLSLFGLLRYCSYVNLFRLIDSCIIICWFLLPILFEPNTCRSSVLSDFSFVVNLA